MRCGSLTMPEDLAAADGRQIDIRITVVPSLSPSPQPDPLVILSGGPGQAANDFYSSVGGAFARIRRDRDIVLIDQRGTGDSHRLDCGLEDETDFTAVDPQRLRTQMRTCLGELAADPRFYTTSVAVHDLEKIREALGYPALNLYSVSYGTRVAQHYLRRYPAHVRSVILDGAVPVGLALGPDAAIQAQQALDALFDRCAAEEACSAAFPDIHAQFDALQARLRKRGIKTKVPDPIDAAPIVTSFGIAELGAAVRLLSYSDETASLLPLLIHEAQVLQRPQDLIAQYLMVKRSAEAQIAYGMHFAVVCSEDAPYWAEENVGEQALAATYMGKDFMQSMQAVCEEWPRGRVDEDFRAPLTSTVPALILSGSNDPVTPQSYGERALQSFSNGRHLVLNGQGHGQLGNGCMPMLIAQFVAGANAKALDAGCLANVRPAPFMLSKSATKP